MKDRQTLQRKPGAVLYTRVSTEDQAERGTSPDAQRDTGAELAGREGLPIIAVCADEGVSGKRYASRPGIQHALHLLETGQASVLIATKIDRIGRSASIILDIARRVRQAGAQLLTSDFRIDDSPVGQFTLTMFAGMAELEHSTIGERLTGGHHRRAKAGIQTARASAPYGYAIPTKADITRGTYPAELLGKYLINEAQAKVAAELFTRYAAGRDSLGDLCRWLNQGGIPTPGRAAQWRVSNLQYLLRNPVYKGQAVYGRFDHATDEARLMQADPRTGIPFRTLKTQRAADPETWITWPVPALVGEDVWDAVQAALTGNQRLLSGNPNQVRMLTGRVVCPECGAGMVCVSPGKRRRADGTTHTPPSRYFCGNYRRTLKHTGAGECSRDGYGVPDVEAAVILALLDACQNPASIEAAQAEYARRQAQRLQETSQEATKAAKNPRQELAVVVKALGALETRHTATVQAQVAGIMAGADPGAYNALFGDIAAERKDLEGRRGVLSLRLQATRQEPKPSQAPSSQAALPDAAALLGQARKVLEAPGVAGVVKRDIVGAVIERVICRKGKKTRGRGKIAGAEIIFRPGALDRSILESGSTFQPSGKVWTAHRDRDV